MRILLSTYGSRGDVEPMAALAVVLKAMGVEARVSAPPEPDFAALLVRAGVEATPAFMSVRQWTAQKARPAAPADFATLTSEMVAAQHAAIGAAAEGCDAIVATGLFPSMAAAHAVAEQRGIPYLGALFCPLFLPSHHHSPFIYPGQSQPPDGADNRTLWSMNAKAMQGMFGGAANAHRVSVGLPPLDPIRDPVFSDRPLLASDPVLWPWQDTDVSRTVQTGAWILADERPLPSDLLAFLDAGSPPVYVGFGSLPAPPDAARAIIGAIRAQGRRAIVAQGWAALGLIDDRDDGFAIGEVNQQTLFQRVAAVVHHGGAGTTTAAARAGAAQVIVPQVDDQPYWAARVEALGIGVAHDGPTPTSTSLSAALGVALRPDVHARATTLAPTIRSDGADIAAKELLRRLR